MLSLRPRVARRFLILAKNDYQILSDQEFCYLPPLHNNEGEEVDTLSLIKQFIR